MFRPEIASRRCTSDKNQTWKDKLRSKLRLNRLSHSNVSRPDDVSTPDRSFQYVFDSPNYEQSSMISDLQIHPCSMNFPSVLMFLVQ